MKSKSLTLAIIIPAYNEQDHIVDCLFAISRQTVKPEEVILVDNNCSDNTVQLARQYDFVKIIHEPKQGIVYARNAGFDQARSKILARIDADTILDKDWVKNIKEYFTRSDSIGTAITGAGWFRNIILPPASIGKAILVLIAFRFNRLILGHYILWGANMAFWRCDWEKVRLSICYDQDIHEDLDLAIHLNKLGVKINFGKELEVSVIMKRVINDWRSLYGNMMWWPNTLRRHNNWKWMLGYVGAWVLILFSIPLHIMNKPFDYYRKKLQIIDK